MTDITVASMQFIEDREIDLRTNDLFDSLSYSSTLADTIKNSPIEPFTIGIFGEWGSGKSSIVKTAKCILDDEKDIKYHFFTYDAWKYSNDSFRRTFLRNLATSFGLEENDMFRSFYETRTDTYPVKRIANKGLLILVVLILVAANVLPVFSEDSKWQWSLQTFLMSITLFISFSTSLFKEYVGTRQNPVMFSPEQFEACFDEILSIVMRKTSIPTRILGWFKGEGYKRNVDRLVIVLDNIDRCEMKSAYELLSAFKNFLGKPGVVFVIPVDDTALRTHVSSINGASNQEADEFLRKIFNNTIKIKPYKTQDLYGFTSALSVKYNLNLKPDTIDVISKEYATNPRRIIQFINSLISEKNYISRRMDEGFVSQYETLIALILLIREEWPELYRQLSDAPYKLKNLKQSLDLAGKDARKEIFLRKTNPHTEKIDDKVLKIIFTNQEQYPHVSESVIRAIAEKDSKTLKDFIDSSAEGVSHISDYMLEELRHAVGRGVLASLASAFNGLVFLNSISSLPESTNKRILGELSHDEVLQSCIENFDNAEHLAYFLCCLEAQSLYKPQNHVLDYLHSLLLDDEESEPATPHTLNEKWSELIKKLVKSCNSERILNRLQKPFFVVFRDEDFLIEELDAPKQNIKTVSNTKLVDIAIARDDFTNESRHSEFLFLINCRVVSEKQVEQWIQEFLSKHGNFSSFNKEEFLDKLRMVAEVLSAANYDLEPEILNPLVDLAFVNRPRIVSGRQQGNASLVAEINGDEKDVEVIVDLFCWIYASTSGKASLTPRMIELAAQNDTCELLVIKKLQWLHDRFSFKLRPFHDFLQSRSKISAEILKIYDWILVLKDNKKNYVLSDSHATAVLQKCIDTLIVDGDSFSMESLFADWVKDDRAKEILTRVVSSKEKSVICDLPKSVLTTAYSHISSGDNIFEYEDDTNILVAMNHQDKSTFNKKIEKVVLGKLVKEETFVAGVKLLMELSSFKGMNLSNIRSLLEEKSSDTENGELIQSCLAALPSA